MAKLFEQPVTLATWLPTLAPTERQTLAVVWNVAEHELAQVLSDPAFLRAGWEQFDSVEQAVIIRIQAAGGSMLVGQLENAVGITPGTIRPHAGIVAPRTYLMALQGPASPLERLFIRGWVHRVRSADGIRYVLPTEVLTILPAAQPPATEPILLHVQQAPKHVRPGDPLQLVNELVALVGLAYQEPLALQHSGGLDRASLKRLAQRLAVPDPSGLSSERRWPEAAFLRVLAQSCGLVTVREAKLRVSPQLLHWLDQPLADQIQALVEHWITAALDDLALLLGLRWRTPPRVAPSPYARRALLTWLAELPEGWLALDGLLALLKQQQPTFARPDKRFDGWLLTNAQEHMPGGWDSWDSVDGALAGKLLTGPCWWLGLVDRAGSEREPLLRVSGWARALYGQADWPTVAQAPLQLNATGTILVDHTSAPLARFQVQRIAEWQSFTAEGAEQYQLTLRSFDQAVDQQISLAQIEQFLQTWSASVVPDKLRQQLATWHKQREALRGTTKFVVQATEASLLAEIVDTHKDTLPAAERLSAASIAFAPADAEQVVALLRAQGYALATELVVFQAPLGERDLESLLVAAQVLLHVCTMQQLSSTITTATIERLRLLLGSAQQAAADQQTRALLKSFGVDIKD